MSGTPEHASDMSHEPDPDAILRALRSDPDLQARLAEALAEVRARRARSSI